MNEEGPVRIPRDVLEELEAAYDGWRTCETLEYVGEHKRLVDRFAERNPGTVDRFDAAIARQMLELVRRSIERHGESPFRAE